MMSSSMRDGGKGRQGQGMVSSEFVLGPDTAAGRPSGTRAEAQSSNSRCVAGVFRPRRHALRTSPASHFFRFGPPLLHPGATPIYAPGAHGRV